MKNYETFVMTLYDGIFQDAAIRWPDIRSAMEKDLSYLRSALKERGFAFFTLTLPDFGHWIDRSMDQGSFVDHADIPRGVPTYRRRPVLFRGVLMKVFHPCGKLRPDADHEAVLYLRTLCQSFKKTETPVKPSALKKTVKEFFDVEEHLPRSWPNTWDCEIPIWTRRTGHPLWGVPETRGYCPDLFGHSHHTASRIPWDTLSTLCRRVTAELGEPDWWTLRSKHGPGVTSERGWGSKFDFPNWSRKLELFFPFDWFGHGSLQSDYEPSRRELPSRLCAVPKTQKGPRLICAEPLSNQWMQQGIWDWLRDRVRSTVLGRSIRFESQDRSQEWALSSSHDGSKATLDLSAASDRLCTRLVEYVFQGSDILNGIHACRTRSMEQTLDSGFPKLTVLRKFATMGSALTFPVQTIIFTILSVWALRLYEGREDDWKDWKADFDRVRVFGDDIIVPKEVYGITKFVLHECGLEVNMSKSFAGEHFRESCGMDAFDGVDVTPARHRKPYSGSPSSTAALVEYSNNLFKKGMWNASERVLETLPVKERKLLWIGGSDDGPFGLRTFCRQPRAYPERKTIRMDRDLQREYTLRLGILTRGSKVPGEGSSRQAQYFTEHVHDSKGSSKRELLRFLYRQPWRPGTSTVPRLTKSLVRVYC